MVIKATRRAPLPCRRLAHLPRRRQRARAAHRRSPGRRLVGAELSQPRAGRESADRDRLPACCTVEKGDVFVLATDGVYEHVGARFDHRDDQATTRTISTRPPERSSRRPTSSGSPDNLTVQIVRIDELPDGEASELFGQASRAAAAAAARSADGVRRLPDRPRAARQQPQPHLSRGRHRRPTRWSSSRSRRSTCAATRPTSSAS